MKGLGNCVAFVGPLPPPIHGLAIVSQAMLEEIRRHATVEVFNRAPRVYSNNRREGRARASLRTPGLVMRFARLMILGRVQTLYLAVSGGLGLLQDLPFAAFGIIARRQVYVHHHSFAYLEHPRWYSKLTFWLLQRATHIVLCDRMKHGIASQYGISESRILTLSNAAFLENLSSVNKVPNTADFVIGFLSNITEAKGIFTFLEVALRLQNEAVSVTMLVGGPIAKEIEDRFWAALRSLQNTEYLGPLYGREKQEFFERLDLFLFPSNYENEAEPVVVFEAMRSGVPTLATPRGCLGHMLRDHGGATTPDGAAFEDFACEWIRSRLNRDKQSRSEERERSLECFASHRQVSLISLSSILAGISGKD